MCVFWTPTAAALYDLHSRACHSKEDSMVAIIGNVLAGLLAAGLFTATVRLSK